MRSPMRWLADFARKDTGNEWGLWERMMGWGWGGAPSTSGANVSPQNAMQTIAVYACVKVLSESVGMLPCNLQKVTTDRGRSNAVDHPLFALLHDQPNDYQTAPEFWEMMVAHMCLRGNGYAYINRTRSGDVVELLPQNPDRVTPEMKSDYTIVYHMRLDNGQTTTIDMGNMLHCRGLSLDGWRGISPIQYARESIGLAVATERFGSLLFKNGAKMGGVLSHPGKLSEEAYNRLKGSFDASTSGENSHKTALLEEGMKWDKVSMSSNDAQFLETRKYQRSEIASLYRVPPHMIGDLEKATFSNIEQQSLEFAVFTLMPWLVRLEKSVKRDCLREEERKTMALKFNTAALMRGDAASRTAYYAGGITNGWLTRNEVREAESDIGAALNPIDGLNEPLKPLNMIGINEKPPAPATSPTAQPGSGGKPQNPPATPPVVHSNDALAESVTALALAVSRAPPAIVHSEPRFDLSNATITHEARPLADVEFVMDAEGNVRGAKFLNGENANG